MSIFTFYGGSKQATTKFFFLFVNFVIFLRDSVPVEFSYVSESKRVGIIAMEIERMRIHFFSDIFAALAVLRSPF